jgi:hypothetical protein
MQLNSINADPSYLPLLAQHLQLPELVNIFCIFSLVVDISWIDKSAGLAGKRLKSTCIIHCVDHQRAKMGPLLSCS